MLRNFNHKCFFVICVLLSIAFTRKFFFLISQLLIINFSSAKFLPEHMGEKSGIFETE